MYHVTQNKLLHHQELFLLTQLAALSFICHEKVMCCLALNIGMLLLFHERQADE